MTESEVIEYFKNYIEFCEKDGIGLPSKEPYNLAITALKEIQEYRKLGTVEELREEHEKNSVKKPNIDAHGFIKCAYCQSVLRETDKFCHECGISIDWSVENDR